MKSALAALVAAALLTPAATGQDLSRMSSPEQKRDSVESQLGLDQLDKGFELRSSEAGTGCTGGIQYDDGTFEDGIRTTSTHAHNFVTRFDMPGAQSRLNAVCVCFSRSGLDSTAVFRLNVYAADGPGGRPGTLLGFVTPNVTTPPFLGQQFVRVEFPEDFVVPGQIFVGPAWSELLDEDFFLCTDDNGPGGAVSYFGTDLVAAPTTFAGTTNFQALGIRVEAESIADPDPPAGAWLTTPQIPAFQFKARITAGASTITPNVESDCLAETLCLSGALAGRSELFARVIGPRPNGFLWVNLVRFTTSQVEVWVQRRTGGDIRYYNLPAIPGDSDDLSGLVDKQAFTP
jgi:hypothetical protein